MRIKKATKRKKNKKTKWRPPTKQENTPKTTQATKETQPVRRQRRVTNLSVTKQSACVPQSKGAVVCVCNTVSDLCWLLDAKPQP